MKKLSVMTQQKQIIKKIQYKQSLFIAVDLGKFLKKRQKS